MSHYVPPDDSDWRGTEEPARATTGALHCRESSSTEAPRQQQQQQPNKVTKAMGRGTRRKHPNRQGKAFESSHPTGSTDAVNPQPSRGRTTERGATPPPPPTPPSLPPSLPTPSPPSFSVERKAEMALKSTEARKRGNEYFKSACLPGFSPVIQTSRFANALTEYVRARALAVFDEDQLASASKNIGSTRWRLALLTVSGGSIYTRSAAAAAEASKRAHQLRAFLTYATGAEISLQRAGAEGMRAGKGRGWCQGVHDQLDTVITVTKDMLVAGDGSLSASKEDLDVFYSCLRTLDNCHIKAFVYLLAGVVMFKSGVATFSNQGSLEFVPCLSAMKECRPLLLKSNRLASTKEDEDLKERIGSYLEQVDMQQSICEARQAVAEGDRELSKQLEEEEQPDIDMIWTIVDMYRQGILLAREKCLESEALALSRLGVIYHKVLKLRSNAKKCFASSLDLAGSLHPKDLSGEDWHAVAQCGLVSIKRLEGRLEAEESAKRKRLRSEIKGLLDPIDAIMDRGLDIVTKIRSLLKYLYKTHPPKLKTHTIGSLAASNLKKTLMKSIMHYHTDTQQKYNPKNATSATSEPKTDNIEWGVVKSFDKWEVLCGEISRHLNFLYTNAYKDG